jgi:CHAT domain-containing protein/tetratricopeptide (TPR) repeat protein
MSIEGGMNLRPGHLTDEQLQQCARTSPADAPQEAETHLAECEFCLERLLHWQQTQFGRLGINGMRPEPYPACPAESVLQQVAAEIAAPATANDVLQHAACCDHCGPVLNRYLQDFSEASSPEIEALIDQLPISQPQWQRQKARDIVRTAFPNPAPPPFWKPFVDWVTTAKIPVFAGATAAVLLVGGAILRGPALIDRLELHNENRRVAAAYAEKRTIELRFTGVDAGPYQKPTVTLSQEDPTDELSRPALNEAQSKLSRKLTSGSELDPQWLQIKGRLLLLKDPRNAQMAEEAFQQAQAKGLRNPGLEIDLAVSNFEREIKSDNPNLSKAIDQLKKVLESTRPAPNREEKAVALFDLALAYEKTKAWDLALATWKEYLEADPSGSWADEARKHLAEAQSKVSRQQSYKDPADFNRHISDPEVKNDVEQYQEIALGRWLPAAIEQPMSDSARATRGVAGLMAEEHSDPMWMDLVNSTRKADLPAAQALSAAFEANQNDQHYEALIKSQEATRLFGQRVNIPGEMLSSFQEIYALRRSLEGDECLAAVDRLWPRVFATRYRWLQGQLALERAMCANLVFKFQTAQANVELSRSLASEARYNFPELRLRITGIDASMKRMNYEYDAAWAQSVEGLDDYWKHSYSSERLYQFYTVMRLSATETNSFHTSRVLLGKTIEILRDNAPDDNAVRAVLYLKLASLLHEQGQDQLAEAEAKHARDLLQKIPEKEPTARTYTSLAVIQLADFELRRHRAELALSAILPVGVGLKTRDYFVQLDFHRVQGDARLQLNQLDEALAEYREGLRVARQSLLQLEADETSRLSWMNATEKTYRGVVQILLAKHRDEEALIVWESFKSMLLNRGADNVRLLDVGAEPRTVRLPRVAQPHIVYASFPDRLQIWIVQGTRSQSLSLPVAQPELLKMIRDFNRSCRDPKSPNSEVEQQAARLYERLLQPAKAALGQSDTVAIEFDPSLPALSFEALRSPEGRYFGAEHAVFRSPGLLAEGALRPPAPLNARDPFLVVDASPASGPGFLPGHELATEAIASVHPNTSVLTNTDLTSGKVKQALRNSTGFLILSHGRRGGNGIALQLSSDSSLRSKDFSPDVVARLRLAVMAACSSGSAENGILDADSLVRALLAGGVPNVIASHWNVDSASTGELFASFYLYLSKGETEAQALRDARKEMLSKDGAGQSHPYYWAGFDLTGRAL